MGKCPQRFLDVSRLAYHQTLYPPVEFAIICQFLEAIDQTGVASIEYRPGLSSCWKGISVGHPQPAIRVKSGPSGPFNV